jgi:pyruvate,water dikinase
MSAVAERGERAELPHELRDASVLHEISAPCTAWSTVNTAEALPGLVTPLSWSFWAEPLEVGMRGAFADMGALPMREVRMPTAVDERFSAVFFGRVGANVDRLRYCADRVPGTSGAQFEQQVLSSVRPDAPGGPTRRRYPMIAARLPVAAARIPVVLGRFRALTRQWWGDETQAGIDAAEPAQLRALLGEAQDRFRVVMRPHILATMLSQAAYQQLCGLTAAAGQDGAELELATGYGGMEESAVLDDLWEVSRGRMGLDQFVRSHGYHGPLEGEVSSPSWRANPRLLDALVASHSELTTSPAARQHDRAEIRAAAERRLLKGLGRAQRLRAHAVLRFAARHIPLREVGKATFLQAIDIARYAATGLGVRLHDTGLLVDPNDVFLLTVSELRAGATPEREVLEQRRELRRAYAPLALPERWVGNPDPTIVGQAAEISPGEKLTGVPVSGGLVEGRVRVVVDPASSEADEFEPDEILVCGFTDPSWTPLMNLAAALVIDVGGALSHGAIVARELGVPAVINTGDAARRLRTGDYIRVDASAGTVELLGRP